MHSIQVATGSVGIDPGQTCLSIRFISGQVKSMFLTDRSVEWDFGWARLYQLLVNKVKSAQCYDEACKVYITNNNCYENV
jgi:hypothetical protein